MGDGINHNFPLPTPGADSGYEQVTSKLYVDPAHVAEADKDDFAKYAFHMPPSAGKLMRHCSAFARIENHYFINSVSLCAGVPMSRMIVYICITGLHAGWPAIGPTRDRQDVRLNCASCFLSGHLTIHQPTHPLRSSPRPLRRRLPGNFILWFANNQMLTPVLRPGHHRLCSEEGWAPSSCKPSTSHPSLGLARDHAAHRPRRRPLLARAWNRQAACRGTRRSPFARRGRRSRLSSRRRTSSPTYEGRPGMQRGT